MTLRRFIVSVALCVGALCAKACFEPLYGFGNPLKFHFYNANVMGSTTEAQRAQNIALWKEEVASSVPAEAVEEAVYKTTLSELRRVFASNTYAGDNEFLEALVAGHKKEAMDFLLLAKEVEELREARLDEWYYPSDRSGYDRLAGEQERFDSVMRRCEEVLADKDAQYADRYAFQGMRVLRTLERYKDAIDWYDKYIAWRKDDNLFKQMARHYLAGCLVKTGRVAEGEKIFAELGDFMSIGGADWEEKMAAVNPENGSFKYRINGLIGYGSAINNMYYLRVADAALSSEAVKHRGDWLFLKAYVEYFYAKDNEAAARYIAQALSSTFSTPEMAVDARVFDICVRADLDRTGSHTGEDVAWLYENHSDDLRPLWLYVVPSLLRQGRRAEAILVANVGNLEGSATLRRLYYCNTYNYMHPGVRFMLSGSVSDMEAYMRLLNDGRSEMVKALKPLVCTDADYLNEITGTLCLREGSYGRAVEYLEKVSPFLQFKQGIFRARYLAADPFVYYDGLMDEKYVRRYRRLDGESHPSLFSAKLKFAKRMVELQAQIKAEKDPDKRILASMEYEVGRYNSFTICWALTQYWLTTNSLEVPEFFTYGDDIPGREADYLIDRPREYVSVVTDFAPHITRYRNALQSDEAKAKVSLWMREYKTVARLYPDSPQGCYLAAHCDNWKDWL